MRTREAAVAFSPSDYCIGAGRSADDNGAIKTEGKWQGGNLSRSVDFYVSILAMAAHDLRQPLQAVIAAHELLAKRITGGPERGYLRGGEQASEQLAEILEQLSDALRIHQHVGRIKPEPVRLGPILQRLARQLDGRARRKGVDFRVLPTCAQIMSKPVLIDGMLRNLAHNALDHTLPGGRVLVGCKRVAATVRVEVHDTGKGIPPDKLGNIFEPFFRIDATRSEGLGLGLFIVGRAADCLGHRIELRSAVGRGSCFSIVAPAAVV
jgi:two-component system, OmpR family, phosphate regulon sensor histidine kinase PhoR